uniref:Uncharacterized protein n=1 Tax=Oryzias latipes TaxID=8090 RepID=A0A3P9M125_ORYLA
MGQKISIPTSNSSKNDAFLLTNNSRPSLDPHTKHQPSIFSMLMKPLITRPGDPVPLISNCISTASARTQEFLLFKDPEAKFQPSPHTLTQVETQDVNLNLTDIFNCTAMTPEQQILLGADWVWAILERPSKNPKTQIAVQVLHLPERDGAKVSPVTAEDCSESIRMAWMESRNKNVCERMVDFCTSIGKDCYALFLFFGRMDDKENIYGVLSNNFDGVLYTEALCRLQTVLNSCCCSRQEEMLHNGQSRVFSTDSNSNVYLQKLKVDKGVHLD